jgi:L-amino acid N-acyltransferase YncA
MKKKYKNQREKPSIFAGLTDFVKDPANYEAIQRQLLDTLASKHSHADVSEWVDCVECQMRVKDHKDLMFKLGFKDSATYMAWRKVHETIKNRSPLIQWNRNNLTK